MNQQTKSAISELIQQGFDIARIMDKLRLGDNAELTVTNMYNNYHSKNLNKKITSLQQELARRKSFEIEFRKAQEENKILKEKIRSMEGAIESVNSLTAERSKLIRKLKRAGIKV